MSGGGHLAFASSASRSLAGELASPRHSPSAVRCAAGSSARSAGGESKHRVGPWCTAGRAAGSSARRAAGECAGEKVPCGGTGAWRKADELARGAAGGGGPTLASTLEREGKDIDLTTFAAAVKLPDKRRPVGTRPSGTSLGAAIRPASMPSLSTRSTCALIHAFHVRFDLAELELELREFLLIARDPLLLARDLQGLLAPLLFGLGEVRVKLRHASQMQRLQAGSHGIAIGKGAYATGLHVTGLRGTAPWKEGRAVCGVRARGVFACGSAGEEPEAHCLWVARGSVRTSQRASQARAKVCEPITADLPAAQERQL